MKFKELRAKIKFLKHQGHYRCLYCRHLSRLLFNHHYLYLIFSFTLLQDITYGQNYHQAQKDPSPVKNSMSSDQLKPSSWVERILTPDDRGIMKSMAKQVKNWEDRKNYIDTWNLNQIEGKNLPTTDTKKSYIKKNALKFLDQKLSQEMKRSEKNTVIYQIGHAQKALNPTKNIQFSDHYEMKFKAEIIQGKATILLTNPLFQSKVHYYAYQKGNIAINIDKNLEALDLTTMVQYQSRGHELSTVLDQKITDNISGKISYIKAEKSDKRVELLYQTPF